VDSLRGKRDAASWIATGETMAAAFVICKRLIAWQQWVAQLCHFQSAIARTTLQANVALRMHKIY